MQYQKAMEILSSPSQQHFSFFLTLSAKQLAQLTQVISQQHQSRIYAYLKKHNHTPLNTDTNQPQFAESIKTLYRKLFFDNDLAPKQENKQENGMGKVRNDGEWFKELFIVEDTKEKIKQNQFNYPYFYVIKRLLIAHNAPPLEDSVKIMHLQLQILMKRIFSVKLMDGLRRVLGVNKQTYQIPKQETQRNITANHLKTYLSKVFQKQYSNFKQFKSEYNKIKKDVEVQPSDEEDDPSESEKQTEVLTEKQLHCIADTEQQINYYLLKTQKMNSQELIEFYKARETNFNKQGTEKLITFTRIGSILGEVRNKELIELLSYILCMSARRIIFTKIREIRDGKLLPVKEPISSEDIQLIGNQYVEEAEKKARSYCLKYQTYIKKAYELFKQEFYSEGYNLIFISDNKIKLINSDENISVVKNDQVGEAWKKNKEYRKAWYERVAAEAQLKQFEDEEDTKEFNPINQYAEFLKENKNGFRKVPNSKIFKSFLFKQPLVQEVPKPQKRLQSLFQ